MPSIKEAIYVADSACGEWTLNPSSLSALFIAECTSSLDLIMTSMKKEAF